MLYKKINLQEEVPVSYFGIKNAPEIGFVGIEEKIAQCRYCINSSHEGPGIWFKDGKRWICGICLVELEEQHKLREKEKETNE